MASWSFQEKSDPPAAGRGSGHGGKVVLRNKVESKTDPRGVHLQEGEGGQERAELPEACADGGPEGFGGG